MPDCRRAFHAGGTYFFTVNLLERGRNDLLVRHIDLLRDVVRDVKRWHPFNTHGWVTLPDHLHCVIELPENDHGCPLRWRLIKMGFSKGLPKTEGLSLRCAARGERGIWQRRYWKHLIRDERDFQAHIDYVHINPVKHGLVSRVVDWPYSTFHRLVKNGVYVLDWAGGGDSIDYPD